ncbi:bifunctional pyr operon transcriptional regulator/uracil phosphoribosyltransferase PyrR [Nocardioides sp.]|uniref:bifunctional pyr operon transcriptional regulator/uracil phosphoribosyltransferase PyrR n=1 Tax=Nocardioides sp. TaxID=35761 RepID=UPI002B27AFBB|nr:bifunctional pyr operon transcriptional regulator/uracil phosphoribosyltransferase PyrR [Nocardioides sp.]
MCAQPAPDEAATLVQPDQSPDQSRVVLDARDITRALTRISHEILERNKGAGDLVLLGIPSRGVPLARRIAARIKEVEGVDVPTGALDITMYRDDLRKHPARAPQHTAMPPGGIDDKTVVLVDDVLYSGRTVRAALDAMNDIGRPAVVRLAVLVDRGHRELPIRADHVGKNLPSARAERVLVRLLDVDDVEGVWIASGAGEQA